MGWRNTLGTICLILGGAGIFGYSGSSIEDRIALYIGIGLALASMFLFATEKSNQNQKD